MPLPAGVLFDADCPRTDVDVVFGLRGHRPGIRQTERMADLYEDSESRAAFKFARAIADFVGTDAQVATESPVAEFDCIVSVVPHVQGAVVMDVMVFGTELVVVWARSPRLGWWTFEGPAAQSDSWAVIEQIVNGGGEVAWEKRASLFSFRGSTVRLLGLDGVPVSVMDDGGAGPKRRVTTFPPYRSR